MNKTIFLGITIGVIAVAMITLSTVSMLDFIAMGKRIGTTKCTTNYGDQTRRWCRVDEKADGSWINVCQTCKLFPADQCTTIEGAVSQPGPACRFGICDPVPSQVPGAQDTPTGGIFQGDIISTPGPGAQDTPSTTQGGIFQGGLGWYQETPTAAQDTPTGGIFQGNLLGLYSQQGLIQSDPESETPPETNTTQPGGTFREDLEQLGATQDNETTSEDGVTEELPAPEENMTTVPSATEETQPALVQEEPVPTCPEGQVLDEETNLCVLEEPEADEPEQEEAEEEPSSEEEDEN